jgi:hypothetical protein
MLGTHLGCRVTTGGFALIEALIAAELVIGLATRVAQLIGMSARAVRSTADQTSGLLLAVQKLEQLRALEWSGDRETGVPSSDLDTDLSHDPPRAGGSGLAPSPGSSLARDTPDYVDYLDAGGRWIGTGAAPPPGTVYVRRWVIAAHDAGPDDLRVLHVVVMSLRRALALSGAFRAEAPGVTWLATLRARV